MGVLLASASGAQGQDDRCAPSNPPLASFYGEVRSETGEPVEGVSVLVTWESGRVETLSRADGSYLLCSVPHGVPIAVTAAGELAVGRTHQLELPDPERFELDLDVESISNKSTVTGSGAISGVAVDADTGAPIVGARVSMARAGVETVTGDRGAFRLDDLPTGTAEIIVEHIGYGQREAAVEIDAHTTTLVRLHLALRAITLAPIEVEIEGTRLRSLETRGFYERRVWGERLGLGRFFADDEIRRRNPRLITHLIADVPGATLDCSGSPGSRACELRFMSSPGCSRANVYLNGMRVIRSDNQAAPMPLDQLVQPHEVVGVEVYRSAAQVPAEFGGSTGQCGAVVIWTR